MDLAKTVITLSLAMSLSAFNTQTASSQVKLSSIISKNTTELEKEQIKGIPKPEGYADLTLDIRIQKGILPAVKIGNVEVRSNSLYASLLFGHYQILFEQVNDSTFVEHLFSRSLSKDSERYEVFTTKKLTDTTNQSNYFILDNYTTTKGIPREEKIPLKNTKYPQEFTPAIIALNKFLNQSLENKVNIIVLGVPYTFNLYEKKERLRKTEKNTNAVAIINYAKMSEILETPDDTFLLEEYLNLYTRQETKFNNGIIEKKIIPEKFESNFKVVNSGLWNGEYKATGIVRERN